MLFNSLEFLIFFPLVFIIYWLMPSRSAKPQNIILFIAGYVFYGAWDIRFLGLLMFSTLLDFLSGIMIERSATRFTKKSWLLISIIINLGFLAIFKYYDFFAASFAELISHAGFKADPFLLNIILPVGISFYTFHGLSYVIDIYNGKIPACRNFLNYAVFICFFPLLVAGPIERATHLLPQLKHSRKFDHSMMTDGLRQILWGFFKKIVIADSCAHYVNLAFADSSLGGSTMAIAVFLFAVQIYCDFSGYSDIAMGVARMFGIEVLRNFSYPYFSRDIAEFWRRWHISLSSWFRDYVYIPLGGSKTSKWKVIRNIFIIFLLSGFWHGANYTFIIWGALHACYFLPLLILKKNRVNIDIPSEGSRLPSFKTMLQIFITFLFVCFAWIFFRAETLTHAIDVISRIFSVSLFQYPGGLELSPLLFILIALFFMIEWIGKSQLYPFRNMNVKTPLVLRWATYYLLVGLIIYFAGQPQQFIYFQF